MRSTVNGLISRMVLRAGATRRFPALITPALLHLAAIVENHAAVVRVGIFPNVRDRRYARAVAFAPQQHFANALAAPRGIIDLRTLNNELFLGRWDKIEAGLTPVVGRATG